MVEIKHATDEASSTSDGELSRHRLVYAKSKTYIHPTAYARDNLCGFVAIVKNESPNPTYLLAWIPESLLDSRGQAEWENWTKVEEHPVLDEEDKDTVLVELPTGPESYAFSVPLTSIYSLIVNPPSLSSWYGSMAINVIGGSTLPTLYFHDDESSSFSATSRTDAVGTSLNVYPPPQRPAPSTWGGEDLLSRLRSYSNILRSSLQPTLYLLDPSRSDIESHSMQMYDDDAVDAIMAQSQYSNSFSPVPNHRRPRPVSTSDNSRTADVDSGTSTRSPNRYSERSSVLHQSLPPPMAMGGGVGLSTSQARQSLLQSFSSITRATRHAAQSVLSHPLAKPIVPHLPDPVRTFVNAPGEWSSWVEAGGVGEFESARVYLARWARVVAEEGERNRRHEAQAMPANSDGAGAGAEETSLGVFELLHSTSKNLPAPKTSRDPRRPVNELDWDKWFNSPEEKGEDKATDGRPSVRFEEMKRDVFRRGISSQGTLKKRLWPFVLGVSEWDATNADRERVWTEKRRRYLELKGEWCGVKEVFERADIVDERHRIDVDCRRTDRSHPLFAATVTPEPTPSSSPAVDDSKRYSVMSPGFSDIGAQSPSNEHIERLAAILLTYHVYEKDLGYVQGMSDLCAPIYAVMGGDEVTTFWCFVEVMNRMKRNFLRDQSGMKQQLLTLQQLIGVMDPELYRHLEKTDGLNLFFCFRWVLITFKREFSFDDVVRLWEVIWTNYYSDEFVLFVALGVLESHRDVILRYLVEFDEILKYCNDLSMTLDLDSTLAQAEVLFLSFAQLVADIDRRTAEAKSASTLRQRKSTLSGTSDDTAAITKPPKISEELRQLLHAS